MAAEWNTRPFNVQHSDFWGHLACEVCSASRVLGTAFDELCVLVGVIMTDNARCHRV